MAATRVCEEQLHQKLSEDVRKVEEKLHPDVVRIRFSLGEDWSDDPAIFFRIIVSDEASGHSDLAEFTGRIESEIFDELRIAELDYVPYFNFRTKSEQEKLQSPEWD